MQRNRVVTDHGDGLYGRAMDAVVSRVINFDHSCVLLIAKDRKPRLLYDNVSQIANLAQMASFLDSMYVLSPFYQAFVNELLSPISTAWQLSKSCIVHKDLTYLLSVHVSLEPDFLTDELYVSFIYGNSCISYVAMREKHRARFSKDEVRAVRELLPQLEKFLYSSLVSSSLSLENRRDHDETSGSKSEANEESRTDRKPLNGRTDDLLKSRLSRRENELITMTLEGNSVDNIAYLLGISPNTVRVHIRNAYGKLQVRNRHELFAMFLSRFSFGRSEDEL
ncbi:MAG: helix-turn-helix transcriptional regulator [Rhodobacteraceae bacterium]|nr:helix-turn-helix transcriptional regulator [Paracoccaceae bacterium]